MVTRAPRVSGGTDSSTLVRFDLTERVVHWVNAVLFGILIFTGAVLYLAPLQALIGRRALVEDIHLWCGLALPVPLAIAVAGRWGSGLRADLRRLNRWSGADLMWLRSRQHRRLRLRNPGPQAGKFNPGQKLNAAFVAGSGLVMLGTGVMLRWYHPWPLSWRTGATFVHDWLALALGVVIVGHILKALADPEAFGSMLKGTVSRSWASRHARAWLEGRD